MAEVTIHRGELGDLPSLERLLRAVIAGLRARGIDQWDEVYPTLDVFAKDLTAGELYVARVGEIVGALVLNAQQDPEYAEVPWSVGGRVMVVHRLMTDPAVHGQGVARALMAFAEEEARSRGGEVVRLDAFA